MTEPLPKSWWDISANRIKDDDSDEEIERKKLYAKLCAYKKPYFFAYNYSSLKTEYDAFVKTARANSTLIFKRDLDDFIKEYEAGKITDEDELRFMNNFLYKLPLDRSKSTMNKICWAIEKEFDGVDLFKDVEFDYSILKQHTPYTDEMYNLILYTCNEFKSALQLAKKRAATIPDCSGDDSQWESVDVISQNLIETLTSNCNDSNELCEILVDLCYRDKKVPKQVLWKVCGDTIIQRLLDSHGGRITYPVHSSHGDFWCQGAKYRMCHSVVNKGGEVIEEFPF